MIFGKFCNDIHGLINANFEIFVNTMRILFVSPKMIRTGIEYIKYELVEKHRPNSLSLMKWHMKMYWTLTTNENTTVVMGKNCRRPFDDVATNIIAMTV